MRAKELFEGLNHPIIVVDVQPEYANSGNYHIHQDIIKFVTKQTGKVLMFVNAENTDVSLDTIESIKQFWEQNVLESQGIDIEDMYGPDYDELEQIVDWDRFEIVDKGYGHFRSWMDNNVDTSTIIRVIRAMYQAKVDDSRMLFGGEDSEHYAEEMQKLVGVEFEDWMLDDGIYTQWADDKLVAQLKRFNGAYLVGGGREQCLREVEILMNAFNIRVKRIDKLIY